MEDGASNPQAIESSAKKLSFIGAA
jgi:hypothetical protein